MASAPKPKISAVKTNPSKHIRRFELLSIATKEGIWEYDFINKKSFYNEGMIELFGYSYSEMSDNEAWWRNNVHPKDKKRVVTQLDELMESTTLSVWWGKYQFRCRDGSYKLILDRLFLVRDKKNKALRMIGTMQDLTEIDALQQEIENIRKEHHRAIVKAIFQAEENERKYISEELSENINQVLATINIDLAQAKKHVTTGGLIWLQEAQKLLLNSITSISIIAKRLSPLVLKELGLKNILEELLIVMKRNNGISYSIFVDENIINTKDLETLTVLYRIAQQQLHNIVEHSTAKEVKITIVQEAEKLKMSIADNGNGVNVKKIQYGKGFSTIKEKAEAFGGSFNVESMEGKPGFKMEVII